MHFNAMARYKLFLLALAVVSVKQVSTQTVIHIDFNVMTGKIEDLYDAVKVALFEHQPAHLRLDVEGHMVLAPQRANKKSPSNPMLHLHLTGEHNDETTIFITVDDLYVCGFANKSGDNFILKDYNNFFPDQNVLDFGKDYSQLIPGGGIRRLHTIPLGRRSLLHGVHALSWHNPELGDPSIVMAQAQLGVCRCVIMVSESLRLTPIRDSFAPFFDLESFVAPENSRLVQGWGAISKELLHWKDTNIWADEKNKMKKLHIYDATIGLEKVDVILRKY